MNILGGKFLTSIVLFFFVALVEVAVFLILSFSKKIFIEFFLVLGLRLCPDAEWRYWKLVEFYVCITCRLYDLAQRGAVLPNVKFSFGFGV